jgi:hypothetical protein
MKAIFSRDSVSNGGRAIQGLVGRVGGVKVLVTGGAAVLALGLAVGAGAAPSPFTPVAEVLGLSGEHGAAVSEAVAEAKASLEDGDKVGPAVSEAACTAAHDRSTLPNFDADAEDDGEDAKDCTHPSNQEAIQEDSDADTDGEVLDEEVLAEDVEAVDGEEDEPANHGAAVSQAVHDAKASLEDGEKVGPAVSEAACTAAHDRTTLPDGAQNAPGQDKDHPEKDCTHPSNADDQGGEEVNADSDQASDAGTNSHGKASAPGQLKKQ